MAPPAVAPSPSTFCAPTPPVLQSWDLSLLSASQLPLMLLPLSRAPPLSLSLAPPSIRDTSSTPVGRFLLPRRLPPPVDRASFSTPPTTSSTPVGDGFPRCDGIPGPRRPRPLAAEVSGIRRRRRPSSGQRGPLRRQGRSSSGRLSHRTRSGCLLDVLRLASVGDLLRGGATVATSAEFNCRSGRSQSERRRSAPSSTPPGHLHCDAAAAASNSEVRSRRSGSERRGDRTHCGLLEA